MDFPAESIIFTKYNEPEKLYYMFRLSMASITFLRISFICRVPPAYHLLLFSNYLDLQIFQIYNMKTIINPG